MALAHVGRNGKRIRLLVEAQSCCWWHAGRRGNDGGLHRCRPSTMLVYQSDNDYEDEKSRRGAANQMQRQVMTGSGRGSTCGDGTGTGAGNRRGEDHKEVERAIGAAA